MRTDAPEIVEWALAGAPLAGEELSGDLHVVAPFADGVVVAAIDGLGHGPEAAAAAQAAAEIIRANATEPVLSIVQRCHDGLRKSRGVVLSIVSIAALDSSLSWTGVGNVDAALVRADGRREGVPLRGGVVGYQLPQLRAVTLPIVPGDTLFLATDGIHSDFLVDAVLADSPRALADTIFARHARSSDDALIVVARYLGRP